MKIKWYQYFAIGSFVAGWFSKAAVDGKITNEERIELANSLTSLISQLFPNDIELD